MAANERKAMTTQELTRAVELLLDREKERAERQDRRRRRRLRQRHQETQQAVARLATSIEVIKWCIIGIATVMALALVILVSVVWQIGNEAERIKGEVEQVRGEAEQIVRQIQHEADLIRDKIRHPFESLGGTLGGTLGRQLERQVFGGADDGDGR